MSGEKTWNMKAFAWRTKLDEVNDTLKTLSDRQERLKDHFNKLSEKYIATKACVMDSLWRYVPQHCNTIKKIPKLDIDLEETSYNVGRWKILDTLGAGQFSVVKKCRNMGSSAGSTTDDNDGTDSDTDTYAIKMICKDKYRTVDSIF